MICKFLVMKSDRNISDYITEKSKEYHEKVKEIIKRVQKLTDMDAFVFGGYPRDIIRHYYDHQKDSDVSFAPPVDIDIYLRSRHMKDRGNSYSTWRVIMRYLTSQKDVTVLKRPSLEDDGNDSEKYTLYKCIINDITVDICTMINFHASFDTIMDFDINAIYFTNNGQMGLRKPVEDKDINDVISNIEKGMMVPIYLNDEYIRDKRKNIIGFFKGIQYRIQKMVLKGYIIKNDE